MIKFWRFRRDFEEILFFFNVGGGVLLLLVVPLEVERDGLALVQGAETLGIDGGPKSSNNYLIKFWKNARNCYDLILHGFKENNVKNCLFCKISFLSYWWTKTSSEPSAGVMKPKPKMKFLTKMDKTLEKYWNNYWRNWTRFWWKNENFGQHFDFTVTFEFVKFTNFWKF